MEESPTSKTLGYYFFILGGHATSLFGSAVVGYIIRSWFASNASTFFHSMVLILTILPYLIILPFAGVLSDILNRKLILITTNVLRITTTFVLIFLLAFGTALIDILILLSLIRSISDAFYQPTFFTIVPSMVNQKQLGRINGLIYFLTLLPQTFAPYYGAFLLDNFSLFPSLVVMVIVIAITLIPLFLIRIPQTKELKVRTENYKEDSFIVQYFKLFIDGFRAIKLIPVIIILIGAVLIMEFISLSISIFLPIFIISFYGVPFLLISMIFTLSYLGAFIGIHVFVIRKYWNPVLFVFFLSISLIFLADLVFFLAPYRAFALMFFTRFIKGFLLVFIYSMLPTFIQSNIPKNRLGRVSAIYFSISSLITFFSPTPLGILYSVSSDIRLTFSLLIIIGIIAVMNLFILTKILKIKYKDYKVRDIFESSTNNSP